jgi:hypothetical protein
MQRFNMITIYNLLNTQMKHSLLKNVQLGWLGLSVECECENQYFN